jgi:hypothetical protein
MMSLSRHILPGMAVFLTVSLLFDVIANIVFPGNLL